MPLVRRMKPNEICMHEKGVLSRGFWFEEVPDSLDLVRAVSSDQRREYIHVFEEDIKGRLEKWLDFFADYEI